MPISTVPVGVPFFFSFSVIVSILSPINCVVETYSALIGQLEYVLSPELEVGHG